MSTLRVDGHCDTLAELVALQRRLGEATPELHVDVPRLNAAGIGLQVYACCPYVSEAQLKAGGRPGARGVLNMFDVLHAAVEAPEAPVRLVRTKDDLRRAVEAAGTPAAACHAILAVEGGEALEGDIAYLHAFFRLGLRLLTVTHNRRNELADGAAEEATAGGLSKFGREVIAECHRLGIVVDVAHLAVPGFWNVIELGKELGFPVVASHANAKALCSQRRNLTDEQIEAIAATGGLIGVTFVPDFLRPEASASLDDVLDHLEYLIRVAGPDHVGLGSDFDGIPTTPVGLDDVSRWPAVAAGLARRGVAPEIVDKVCGGNWVRVFAQVLPE